MTAWLAKILGSKLIGGAVSLGKKAFDIKALRTTNEFDLKKEHIKANKGWRTSVVVICIFAPILLIMASVVEGWIYQLWYFMPWTGDDHFTSSVDVMKSTYTYGGSFLIKELYENLGVDLGAIITTFIYVGLPIIGGASAYKTIKKNAMVDKAANDHLLKPTSPPKKVTKKKTVRKPKLTK